MDIYDVRRLRLKDLARRPKIAVKGKKLFSPIVEWNLLLWRTGSAQNMTWANGYLDAMECVSTEGETDQEKMTRAQLIEAITMRLNAMPLEKIKVLVTLIDE